jgi:hypothetical protein
MAIQNTACLSTAVSVTALAASGISLWESALKQPDLKVCVTEHLSYTRDPYGSWEVVTMPITIQNRGARDAAVLALSLDIRNATNGLTDRFVSTYTVDGQYFGARDDVGAKLKRPKMPFAPLSIAGRSAYTGTLLFYPPQYKDQRVLEARSKVDMTLRVVVPEPTGWLERVLTAPPPPIAITAEVPNYLPGALLTGDIARLEVSLEP